MTLDRIACYAASMNPNHDDHGRFSAGGGDGAHARVPWAQQFNDFAVRNAFGPSTVSSAALREHMHANNPDVQAAAARVSEAQKAVNVFKFADPRGGFRATPAHLEQKLRDAQRDLRGVERGARRSVGR